MSRKPKSDPAPVVGLAKETPEEREARETVELMERVRKRIEEKLIDHAAEMAIKHSSLQAGVKQFRIVLSKIFGDVAED